MRKFTWGAASAVLTVGVLTGCSSAADKETSASAPASPSASVSAPASAPAAKGSGKSDAWKKADTRIGDAGTACELPISFEAVKAWKPTGLSREDGELLGKFSGHTTFRGACELDAKPAGNIGFIRVWTADNMTDKSPRQVLDAFMSEEKRASDQRFSEVKAGELPAAEVVYKVKTVLADEPKEERALAVTTPKGVTVVHLGGFDTQEHQEMLPAYEQAKKTVRLAS
ncbi:lipoprotein [Streptomyces olivoreticuli]|uniref:lipoprotein n=1 Tax=Streptomyces olivoreticuli TaxID=68246 RepID=UPI00265A68F6|nr:lipoprotein [Streptomyces olivoreticuli]WKK26297.1 lipoprotein [Streptomyces olivoreticuli]